MLMEETFSINAVLEFGFQFHDNYKLFLNIFRWVLEMNMTTFKFISVAQGTFICIGFEVNGYPSCMLKATFCLLNHFSRNKCNLTLT